MTSPVAQETAVRALGYTPREAAFLTCVARHGGYFVRRQFLEWIGREQGQTVVDFANRLVSRRHATVHTYCRTTHVYHLSAKGLYEGLDAGPSLRRRRPAVSIQARLMALDVVMSNRQITFLHTEAERRAFADVLGVRPVPVPHQHGESDAHRKDPPFCLDRALIGAQEGTAGSVVVCVFIDDGSRSTAGFQTYLRRHARLFAALMRWRLIHVSTSERSSVAAVTVMRRAFGCDLTAASSGSADGTEAVLDYFRLRQAYDAQQWTALDTAKLDRFRALRLRFGAALDPLYARWEIEGDHALSKIEPPPFESVVLPHSYAAIEARRRRS